MTLPRLHFFFRRLRPARLVRRVEVRCPADGEPAEVDLLQGKAAGRRPLLRCSARTERPPECDQACAAQHDAVAGRARALLILPPGDDVPDELD